MPSGSHYDRGLDDPWGACGTVRVVGACGPATEQSEAAERSAGRQTGPGTRNDNIPGVAHR